MAGRGLVELLGSVVGSPKSETAVALAGLLSSLSIRCASAVSVFFVSFRVKIDVAEGEFGSVKPWSLSDVTFERSNISQGRRSA